MKVSGNFFKNKKSRRLQYVLTIYLLKLSEHYPNKTYCVVNFKKYLELQGIVCFHSGCTSHYWQSSRLQLNVSDITHVRLTKWNGDGLESFTFPLLVYNAFIDKLPRKVSHPKRFNDN
jgi:hypothetical protein